jgi:hypothetical protein
VPAGFAGGWLAGLKESRMNDDRIVVLEWFDVFIFDQAPTITCPDCYTASPELPDVWTAVRWADDHHRRCPA